MTTEPTTLTQLDRRVAELADRYLPLAVTMLREAIRIPADLVDRPAEAGGDPAAGLSNHERARLEYLRAAIVDARAVRTDTDVWFDDYGNLVWVVTDPTDGVAPCDRRIIYFDGHSDTVQALRDQWHEKLGGAIDPYDGLLDPAAVDPATLHRELGWVPPQDEWEHLVFGRGSADQLAGVISQIIATKILLELADEGSLSGCTVRSYATVAEEDNDGGGPRHLVADLLPGAGAELIPDAVVLTEGTGDSVKGALGIYRGQRGRMQIEVTVVGRSCHGSMPFEGLNPLEFGAAIIVEAARRHVEGDGFATHPSVGRGTRTASWADLQTPSDCAVPDRFTFRFDRRLSIGETPEQAVADVEALDAVADARAAGLTVTVGVPRYRQPTWHGFAVDNAQVYPGWITPDDHPVIVAAVDAYRGVVTPFVDEPAGGATGATMRREPRVDTWVFSTDGVGFPIPLDHPTIEVGPDKGWVVSGAVTHPPMFGIGAGVEQNTHRIGEFVDARELRHAIAVLARFPSAFTRATGR
jgi:putative selenium metabolism hydrolase